MKFIKKHLHLCMLILINIVSISWIRITVTIESKIVLIFFFFLRFVLLPWDSIYLSKKIYATKNKRISIFSAIITIFSFLIVIDPGFFNAPWIYSWLMKYEFIQTLTYTVPGFWFILGAAYIIACDIFLRFIGNIIFKRK